MYQKDRFAEYKLSQGSFFDLLEFQSLKPSGDPKVDHVRARIYNSDQPKGAIVFVHGTSTITMALDKRIEKGVFVVSGGNYEYITWKSIATKVLRISYEENKFCNPQACEKKHKSFDKAIINFKSLKMLEDMPPCFTYDPSLFAKFIMPRETLFFTAMFDFFIPKRSSDDLWKRIGKPKRYILPAGHVSAHIIFKHFILNKTLEFFDKEE